MLHIKFCHRGLGAQTHVFGLEIWDLLILFPLFYLYAVLLNRPFLGVLQLVIGIVGLKMAKKGKLPGHIECLITYLCLDVRYPSSGKDFTPPYPIKNQ